MNVFVLGTGRCGTTTFIQACKHVTNYTAGHESRRKYLLWDRVAYPDSHIESDCRLAWRLGMLERAYGKNAFYVHLTRNRQAVQMSYERKFLRKRQGGVAAWSFMTTANPDRHLSLIVADMLETMTVNIEAFLRDKDAIIGTLETADQWFPYFWERIDAEGDFDAAVAEFQHHYGAFDRPDGMKGSERPVEVG